MTNKSFQMSMQSIYLIKTAVKYVGLHDKSSKNHDLDSEHYASAIDR